MSSVSRNFSRRTVLRGGLAAAAVGAVGASPVGQLAHAASREPYVAYSADSFFKSSLAGALIDTAQTDEFRRFMFSYVDQRNYPHPRINGLDGNLWGTAWARGLAEHPVWRLTGTIPREVTALATTGFHAPAWFGDLLSGTDDSPFVVLDRALGQSVWAANARVVDRYTINVSAAGRFMHDSNGLDKRNPRSNNPLNFRSRGAIPDAMVIRRDLVNHGIRNGTGLGHVMHIFLAETDTSAGFCHPMVGEESENYGFGAEGLRIAIAPSVDLTRRGLSPAALVVARTLQQHGCYIGDNSGSASALKAQQWAPTKDPWQGILHQDSLAGLTWDDFVVVRAGWQ